MRISRACASCIISAVVAVTGAVGVAKAQDGDGRPRQGDVRRGQAPAAKPTPQAPQPQVQARPAPPQQRPVTQQVRPQQPASQPPSRPVVRQQPPPQNAPYVAGGGSRGGDYRSGGGQYRGGERDYGRGDRVRNGVAIGAGIAIIGGVLGYNAYRGPSRDRVYDRCDRNFADFDYDTGTFVNEDGDREICPYLVD